MRYDLGDQYDIGNSPLLAKFSLTCRVTLVSDSAMSKCTTSEILHPVQLLEARLAFIDEHTACSNALPCPRVCIFAKLEGR